MKEIYKNTAILLIFFIVFLFKENIYGLFIRINNLDKLDYRIAEIKNSYYEKEYKSLLKTISLSNTNNYEYTYSKVLYRNIYDYFNEMTILKGKNDSIKKNSAVLNEYGLIGTIKKVNKNSSVVSLITNKNSNISVKINNTFGILKYDNNNLVITSINNYQEINIGDIIYTSGIGSLPEGIKVGTVKEISINSLGIEQKIIVNPAVDIDALNYVAILKGEWLWLYFYLY